MLLFSIVFVISVSLLFIPSYGKIKVYGQFFTQALDAALLHYDADIKKRNARGSKKSNGYV